MRHIRHIILLLILLCSTALQAQTITGLVVDTEFGEPLPYVQLRFGKGSALSNEDGRFTANVKGEPKVTFSFVGFESVTFPSTQVPRVIKMKPLEHSLREVTVLTAEGILHEAARVMKKDYGKNEHAERPYFCRSTINHGDNKNVLECFMQAYSAVNMRSFRMCSGKFWEETHYGASKSSILKSNLQNVFSLAPYLNNMPVWQDLTTPLPFSGSDSYYSRHYNVKYQVLDEPGGHTIYRFDLTPKKKEKIIYGTLYIEAGTYRVLRFEGKVNGLFSLLHFDGEKAYQPADVRMSIFYKYDKGFAEVSNATYYIFNDELDCRCALVSVDEKDLQVGFGIRMGENILSAVEKVGENPDLHKQFDMLMRTDEEVAVVVASGGTDATVNTSNPEVGEERARILKDIVLKKSQEVTVSGLFAYITRAMNYGYTVPQEKVYVHLDNTGYFEGETIWLKAYVMRADWSQRTNLSRVLYVELLNPSGQVVERRTLPIIRGEAWGDIQLKDELVRTGFYEVRAYTRYMLNWGEKACFSRVIPIFNKPREEGNYTSPSIDRFNYRREPHTDRAEAAADEQNEHSVNVHFYPEGGHRVAGLPCRMAYTVTDRDGAPLSDVAVSLGGQPQAGVDRFGRGLLQLDGNATEAQLEVVQNGKSRTHRFSLPKAEEQGWTMQIDAVHDSLVTATLAASSDWVGSKVAWVMMHDGQVLLCDTLTAQPLQELHFQRSRMLEGVSQFTLFDKKGQILAERLFFIHPIDESVPKISLTRIEGTLAPCSPLKVHLKAKPLTSFSFSAIDADALTNGRSGNIRTEMLLASELRGYINEPEYFLETDDREHREATDRLMLVNGWRRYDWTVMASEEDGEMKHFIEDHMFLLGKVTSTSKRQPVSDLAITALLDKGGESLNAKLVTDSAGEYAVQLPFLWGDWRLRFMQPRDTKYKNIVVGIDRNVAPEGRFISPYEARQLPLSQGGLVEWHEEMFDSLSDETGDSIRLLREVVSLAKSMKKEPVWSNETNARKTASMFFDCEKGLDEWFDQGKPVPTLGEWLQYASSAFDGDKDAPTGTVIGANFTGTHDSLSQVVKMGYEWEDIWMNASLPWNENNLPPRYRKWYDDGLSYHGRPILWVINNQFATLTQLHFTGNREVQVTEWASSELFNLPTMLDQVKSIYVADDPNVVRRYIHAPFVDRTDPVVMFVYTHDNYESASQNLRLTTYRGFNVPQTFETNDYSLMPKMEDFRRTLFWAPNVRANANGEAVVEFYNNSSCTNLYLNAEGLTRDGKPAVLK